MVPILSNSNVKIKNFREISANFFTNSNSVLPSPAGPPRGRSPRMRRNPPRAGKSGADSPPPATIPGRFRTACGKKSLLLYGKTGGRRPSENKRKPYEKITCLRIRRSSLHRMREVAPDRRRLHRCPRRIRCHRRRRIAGITRIHHVDYQAKSYVGVYTIYTVIVYGE